MPKMKTKKSVAKRMKMLPSGQIRRNKKNRRHLLTSKTKARKRNLRKPALVHQSDLRRTTKCLPYG